MTPGGVWRGVLPIAAAATALVGCGGPSTTGARKALDDYRRARVAGDGLAACRLLTNAAKSRLSGDCATTLGQRIPPRSFADAPIACLAVSADHGSARIASWRDRIRLVKTEGHWLIDLGATDPGPSSPGDRCMR